MLSIGLLDQIMNRICYWNHLVKVISLFLSQSDPKKGLKCIIIVPSLKLFVPLSRSSSDLTTTIAQSISLNSFISKAGENKRKREKQRKYYLHILRYNL
jgi:hypothetical protein